MGKGDRRTKRGKIWSKRYGKRRPNPRQQAKLQKAARTAAAAPQGQD